MTQSFSACCNDVAADLGLLPRLKFSYPLLLLTLDLSLLTLERKSVQPQPNRPQQRAVAIQDEGKTGHRPALKMLL